MAVTDAAGFLNRASDEMKERAKTYDSKGGERSIHATVTAFNAVTGHNLTEQDGWLFMMLLKAVRANQNGYHEDSHTDMVAYAALLAESASWANEHGV